MREIAGQDGVCGNDIFFQFYSDLDNELRNREVRPSSMKVTPPNGSDGRIRLFYPVLKTGFQITVNGADRVTIAPLIWSKKGKYSPASHIDECSLREADRVAELIACRVRENA